MAIKFVGDNKLREYSGSRRYIRQEAIRMIGSAFYSTLKDPLERRCLWKIEGILSTLIYRLGVNVAISVGGVGRGTV